MAKDQFGLAIRILMGRDDGCSTEHAKALRELIRVAQQKLAGIEAELLCRVPSKHRVSSPQVVAKRELRVAAARAALTIYDSVKLLGRSVGDVWYHELEALRSESTFAASLADRILRYGIPNRPTRVRDFVSQKTLEAMVREATTEARAA